MKSETLDVFGAAMLHVYQSSLENIGISGDLIAVKVEKPKKSRRRGRAPQKTLHKADTTL